MIQILTLIFISTLPLASLAAQKNDHWYKVESKKQEKKAKPKANYNYDSVEKSNPERQFQNPGYWSLRPKLSFSGGYHVDKAFLNEGKRNRLFFNTALQFRQRPWYRLTANALLLQNNSMLAGLSYEITPSRERVRTYYGVGVAHLLVAEKQFSNLVELDAYYATAQYGWEVLLPSKHGYNIEIKGFLSGNDYAIQISAGYIIPL